MGQREPIEQFRGAYDFLSNFYSCEVNYGKYTFGSVENAYQFAKVPKEKIADAVVERFQTATPAKSKAFGKALKEHLRSSDFIARLGGDEFCVIFPNTPLKKAAELAGRLRQSRPRLPGDRWDPLGQALPGVLDLPACRVCP